jgi:hypothetical protein
MYKTIRHELRYARKAWPGTLVDPYILSLHSPPSPPPLTLFFKFYFALKGQWREILHLCFFPELQPACDSASCFTHFAVNLVVHILKRVGLFIQYNCKTVEEMQFAFAIFSKELIIKFRDLDSSCC